MSELEFQPATDPAPAAPGLSQLERVTNTFTAPSKTFADIKRGNKSWWLPFLIMVLVGYVFFAAITMKVGWAQVAENAIHLNPKSEEKLAQAPPESRATAMKITQYSMEGAFAASPILILVGVAIGSWFYGEPSILSLAARPALEAYFPSGCSRVCRAS